MAGIQSVVHQVLAIEEFFNVLIDVVKVGVEDICDVMQLPTNAAG